MLERGAEGNEVVHASVYMPRRQYRELKIFLAERGWKLSGFMVEAAVEKMRAQRIKEAPV